MASSLTENEEKIYVLQRKEKNEVGLTKTNNDERKEVLLILQHVHFVKLCFFHCQIT